MKRFVPHKIDLTKNNGQMGGYFFVILPSHPNATKKTGRVLLHRLVAENKLGRYLLPHEVVHHIDGNRYNNKPSNLEVMSVAEHCRRHRSSPPVRRCSNCRRRFAVTTYLGEAHRYSAAKYCSDHCRNAALAASNKVKSRHKPGRKPSAKKLRKLVWSMPAERVGELFDVSGSTVKVWCRSYGIDKPPRGYWAKQYSRPD